MPAAQQAGGKTTASKGTFLFQVSTSAGVQMMTRRRRRGSGRGARPQSCCMGLRLPHLQPSGSMSRLCLPLPTSARWRCPTQPMGLPSSMRTSARRQRHPRHYPGQQQQQHPARQQRHQHTASSRGRCFSGSGAMPAVTVSTAMRVTLTSLMTPRVVEGEGMQPSASSQPLTTLVSDLQSRCMPVVAVVGAAPLFQQPHLHVPPAHLHVPALPHLSLRRASHC